MRKTLRFLTFAVLTFCTVHLSAAPCAVQGSKCKPCNTRPSAPCKPCNTSCCSGRVAAGIIAAFVLVGGGLAVLLHSSSSAHAHQPSTQAMTNAHG